MKNRLIASTVLVLLFLIACLLGITFCKKKQKVEYASKKNEYSTLQKEANQNIKIDQDTINKLDSIKSVNASILKKYNYLLKHPAKYFYHDTVRIDSIVYLAAAESKQLGIDSSIIKLQKKQIKELFKKDSLSVIEINYVRFQFDSLSNAPKGKGKAFWNGFKCGYLSGLASGAGIGLVK